MTQERNSGGRKNRRDRGARPDDQTQEPQGVRPGIEEAEGGEGIDEARARLARALGLPYADAANPAPWVEEAQEKAARAALFGWPGEEDAHADGKEAAEGGAGRSRREESASQEEHFQDPPRAAASGESGVCGAARAQQGRGREIFAAEEPEQPPEELFAGAASQPDDNGRQEPRGADFLSAGEDEGRTKISRLERLRRMARKARSFARDRKSRDELSKLKGQKEETRRQRRTLLLVLGALAGSAALLVWLSETSRAPARPEVRTYRSDFRLAPESLDKQSFQRQYEERLDGLGIRLKSMEAMMGQLDARLKNLSRDGRVAETDAKLSALEALSGETHLPVAALPPAASVGGAAGPEGRALAQDAEILSSIAVSGAPQETSRMRVVKVAAEEKKTVSVSRAPRRVGDLPLAANRARHEAERTYLPAGSFARAVVLSGVTAPTGGNAAQNPMPLLLEIKDFAQLPNAFRANVKRCFVTANATGDISSERVLVRLDRLSCMNRKGKAVDMRVQGYVTGEDGKAGVRARLVTRSGQAIASALFTGAISGLGKAVSLSAQSTTTYSSGAVGSTVDNAWAAGIGEGVDNAMDRIVNYYLKLADKIFPVLELDSGRTVDIVLAQGLSITFEAPKPEEIDATNSSLLFGESLRAKRENP